LKGSNKKIVIRIQIGQDTTTILPAEQSRLCTYEPEAGNAACSLPSGPRALRLSLFGVDKLL
jgi:hypothetical protein